MKHFHGTMRLRMAMGTGDSWAQFWGGNSFGVGARYYSLSGQTKAAASQNESMVMQIRVMQMRHNVTSLRSS